jgi:hypothetical protein
MAFGLASAPAALAQDRSYDWSNPPPPPGYDNSHWFGGARHCSLDQRDYAYINECGELIPSIWDPFPGRG